LVVVEMIKISVILFFNLHSEMDYDDQISYSSVYLKNVVDYDLIFGDSTNFGYPAIGLYIGALRYKLFEFFNLELGASMVLSSMVHLMSIWTVSKIYKKAFEDADEPQRSNIALLFCVMFFPSTITVSGLSLESWAVMFCLLSIYTFQKGEHLSGILFYSVALSIKMEAFYFLPAVCYLMAMSSGQFLACWGLLFILILQVLFALPFISANPVSYFMHAYFYNIRRSYDTSESMLWGFLPNSVGQNAVFLVLLTLLHGSFLKTMLFTRFLQCKTMFSDLKIHPLVLFPSF
jgi:alpha-1,3-mannosyltransferase